MGNRGVKVNDRVRRSAQQGCLGVIKEIRNEVMTSKVEEEELQKSAMLNILWDNGTLSYLSPDAVEHVDSK